jgi:TRAP-type mannitol/chloroaromatic compound transport system permease small subunit
MYRLIERSNYFLSLFSGILIVIISFCATYGVIRRYAFNSPEPYSYEIGCMLLLASFVLAVSAVEWRDRFIRVDLLFTRLPPKGVHILRNIVSPIIGLVLVTVLTWQGAIDALHAFQIGQTSISVWHQPLYPIKFVITLGYGLLCLALIARLCYGVAFLTSKGKGY